MLYIILCYIEYTHIGLELLSRVCYKKFEYSRIFGQASFTNVLYLLLRAGTNSKARFYSVGKKSKLIIYTIKML